jgi:hypothetical protein
MKKDIESYLKLDGRNSMGEVATPLLLVEEMLDQLPESMFISSTTTFLDPCFGTGTFLKSIAKRLHKYGHSKENIESRIFGIEKSLLYINGIKLLKGFNPTITHIDFLTFKTNMKFDVIIGNPPFQNGNKGGGQNKIYNLFCKQGLNLLNNQGILYFIVPSSVCKKSKRFSLVNQPGLRLVDFTSNNHFKVGVNICSFMIDKSYNGMVKVRGNHGITQQPNSNVMRDLDGIDPKFIKMHDMLKELTNHPSKRMFKQNNVGPESSKSQTESHIHPVYKVDKKQGKILVQYNKKQPYYSNMNKFILPLSKSYKLGCEILDVDDYAVGYVCININNESELESIKSFVFSEYFIQHVQKWKELDGYGFNEALKYLPPFDTTKKWTNDEVKGFFEDIIK